MAKMPNFHINDFVHFIFKSCTNLIQLFVNHCSHYSKCEKVSFCIILIYLISIRFKNLKDLSCNTSLLVQIIKIVNFFGSLNLISSPKEKQKLGS